MKKVKFVREAQVLTQFSLPDYDISFEAGLSIFLHIGGNLRPLFWRNIMLWSIELIFAAISNLG